MAITHAKPVTTMITFDRHAPDPRRRICLEWTVRGYQTRYWYYGTEGEAQRAAEGLEKRGGGGTHARA